MHRMRESWCLLHHCGPFGATRVYPCVRCIFLDPFKSLKTDGDRSEVQRVETKIRHLESLLGSTARAEDSASDAVPMVVSPRFVGPESGAG